jgi:hypothetical protein
MTSHEITAWNSGYLARVTGQRPARRSDYSASDWGAYLEGHAEAAAYLLGCQHGAVGEEPFGDLADAGRPRRPTTRTAWPWPTSTRSVCGQAAR